MEEAPKKTASIPPGDLLRQMLQARGWKQEELALIIGRSITAINNIVTGRSGITPDMASCLAAAFGNDAGDWLQAEAAYRLSLLKMDTSEIEERAKLFSLAPIRDMQRRGWIEPSDDIEKLKSELAHFFGTDIQQLATTQFSVATRRTEILPNLNAAEKAWCFRAKQLAATIPARAAFVEGKLRTAKNELRKLASHPKNDRHVAPLLSDFGIRFVVVEPLGGARIDGADFWDRLGPVIAVSVRYDRIDAFWFTLMHEFSHIAHGDPISIDTEMIDAETGVRVKVADNEVEERANTEAADSLIPTREIESFINRVGPLYPRERIIQFANRIHIHPGIIVGQLQHRAEIGYRSMREFLTKVRDNLISTSLTDGWGQAISPSITRSNKTR